MGNKQAETTKIILDKNELNKIVREAILKETKPSSILHQNVKDRMEK